MIGRKRFAWRSGTAVALVLAATAAQAQVAGGGGGGPCTNPNNGGGVVPGLPGASFLPTSSTISGVQSLVSVLTTQNTAFLTQTSAFLGAPANPSPDLNGGGVWVRGIGGTFDTTTPGNFARFPSNVQPTIDLGSCSVRTFQDYAGFQTGADIARLNVNGYNMHAGVTMGYTQSSVRSNGSFSADFQTPFVGLYGAITKDTFFADAQVRWDFFQGVLNDPNNTLTNQRLDARSVSVTGNVGYQFPLQDGWFIEPSAGAVYAEAKVDRLQSAGQFFLQNPNSLAAPVSVKIRDFDSILARGSLRFGKNIIAGDYALQPFFTASVVNEFGGPVRTDLATDFAGFGAFVAPALGLTPAQGAAAFGVLDTRAQINTYRIGPYGQFSVGLAGQLLNTGWLGYVRGDYRTGDRVDGWGLSGGLRYQFTPEQVARPLITKGATASLFAPLDEPVNWTGFSIGGSTGTLWGQTRQVVDATGPTVDPHVSGVYVGGQIGADWQFDRFVIGLAGDAGWTNARGGRGCQPGIRGNFLNCQSNVDDLYMATARVGYAVGRTLFYAKGGGAFANTSERAQDNLNGQALFDGSTIVGSRVNASVSGWTAGAGFEYALTRNWSAKAEYMHVELERKTYPFSPQNVTISEAQHTADIVKVGVNYRFTFDPAPVVAPVIAKN